MLERLEIVVEGRRRAAMPCQPVLSSFFSPWKGFVLEQHELPALEMPDHWIPYHMVNIGLMEGSQRQFWFESGRENCRNLRSGFVTLVSPCEIRRLRWEKKSRMIAVGIEPEMMRNMVPDALRGRDVELVKQVGAEDPLLRDLVFALNRELEAGCPSRPLYGESLCSRLAIAMMEKYSVEHIRLDQYKGGLARPRLKRVLEYIDSFLDQNLTLDELAQVAGLSRFHFLRAFRQSTGVTVHSYVLSRRVWRAEELLLHSGLNIAEVAAVTGFSSQSHLTTVFRHRNGFAPGAYRVRSANRMALPAHDESTAAAWLPAAGFKAR